MKIYFPRPGTSLAGLWILTMGLSGEAVAQSTLPRPVGLLPRPSVHQGGMAPVPGYAVSGARSTVDPSVRMVQDILPETPAPTLPGTGTAAPNQPLLPDLALPAAERADAGAEPTLSALAAEAEAGEEAVEPTPLMKLLGMENSPVKIYGWLQNSYTGNTNGRPPSGENFGVWPNHKANWWMGNQYYLIVEKPIEQKDEVNFGFRVDNMFGNDWQWNYMQGLMNGAFPLNYFPGYDPAQFFVEAHLPVITEGGLDVKAGRFYTLAGYEVVPAIGRPLLSVPYMFNYGQPFTHMGVLTTLHLTDRINFYNAAINGWDRFMNANYRWGYMGGFSYTSEDEKTSVAFTTVTGPNQYPSFLPANQQIFPTGYINVPGLAGLPNPNYTRNNRTIFTTVVTRKWTDKLTQVIEADQAWEEGIPGLGSMGRNPAPANAYWYSFGNWFLYQFGEKLTGVWRSEVFWDNQGVRTGTLRGDRYYEMTLGMIYKPTPNLWIRPEARYDWSQFHPAYNDGTRKSQFTLAIDAIILF